MQSKCPSRSFTGAVFKPLRDHTNDQRFSELHLKRQFRHALSTMLICRQEQKVTLLSPSEDNYNAQIVLLMLPRVSCNLRKLAEIGKQVRDATGTFVTSSTSWRHVRAEKQEAASPARYPAHCAVSTRHAVVLSRRLNLNALRLRWLPGIRQRELGTSADTASPGKTRRIRLYGGFWKG